MYYLKQVELDTQTEKELELYNIDITLYKVLINRGLTKQNIIDLHTNISKFLVNPKKLVNAQKAADKIIEYLENPNAYIFVKADYDTDGMTSGFIMGNCLKQESKCSGIRIYYPERKEGYGITQTCIDRIMAFKEKKNIKDGDLLVVTVDNGITNVNEIDYFQSHGIEVVVTDHHEPQEKLPNCIIVDDFITKEQKYSYLCGAGVAFKVAFLIKKHYCKEKEMNNFLVPLMIGTIADMMPMSLENIAFACLGIYGANLGAFPTISYYIKNYIKTDKLKFKDVGFSLAPALNSCGRLNNTSLGPKIFNGKNIEEVAKAINDMNEERKKVTNNLVKEIMEKQNVISGEANVVLIEESGVAGIIANKILQQTKRPCICLHKSHDSNDTYTGSCRSKYLDLLTMFEEMKRVGIVVKYGGHKEACSVTIFKSALEAFTGYVIGYVRDNYEFYTQEEELIAIDDIICLNDLNKKKYEAINSIPYDKSNFEAPIFQIDCSLMNAEAVKSNNKNAWIYVYDESVKAQVKMFARGYGKIVKKRFSENFLRADIRLIGTIEPDFITQGKTYTLDIMDIKEKIEIEVTDENNIFNSKKAIIYKTLDKEE